MSRTTEQPRFLVTGALGCIGAWTVRELLRDGFDVVALDVTRDTRRLRLITESQRPAPSALMVGDIASGVGIDHALDAHAVTHIIHLAALQLPFCKTDPIAGAMVNVVGTTRIFEAAKRRRQRIRNVVYASSIAVYGARGDYSSPSVREDAQPLPHSLYGVYKLANEGTARVYWEDEGIPSIGLRPYTVYGPGRDQGMTSSVTKAMLSASENKAYHISFGGRCVFVHARDVARAFILAALSHPPGALVCNVPGTVAHMSEVVSAIEHVVPAAAGRITFADTPLPFPEDFETDSFVRDIGPLPQTPLHEGVRATIAHFRRVERLAASHDRSTQN